MIDDGDWIVYDISFQNDGPQDAWSPVFSDQLPTGMTLVDVLTEIDNTSATLS
ncbi:MAG: hypothetical protein Q8O99_04935 [bacterium]|nr:hypothetical protein [bacterium]